MKKFKNIIKERIELYKTMSDAELQDELDDIMGFNFALLEATESDSIEVYPTPDVKLKISCEVIKGEGTYYN